MPERPPIDPRTGRPRKPAKPRTTGSAGAAGAKSAASGQPRRPAAGSSAAGSDQSAKSATGSSGQSRTPRPTASATRLQPPPRPRLRPKPKLKPKSAGPRPATLVMGSPRRRLRITLFGLLFAFSLFAGRLFQLQAVDDKGYAKAAAASRETTATLFAQRGAILAADGTPLAVSVEAYDVVADPTKVAKYKEDTDELSSKLAGVFATAPEFAGTTGLDATTIKALLTKPDTQYVVLAKKASPATWARVTALSANNSFNAKSTVGVSRNRDDRRTYPGGTLAANLIGFTDTDGVGKGGIEQLYDAQLRGVDGAMSYQAFANVEIPTAGVNLKPAQDGSSVKTTIDPDLQWAAEQALADEVKKSGAASGTVVVEDVATGRLLALANAPTFDPAHIGKADVPNLGNRAFTDPFEPGSVAKVVTMSAAIEEGVATPSTQVPTFGWRQRHGDTWFKDDVEHGDWNLTMTGVLARSSNVGTIEIADMFAPHNLDRDKTIYKYQRLFGFGSKTAIGFPGESAGILAPPQKWSGSQRYTVVFGQGMSATAVQDASVFQTIADGGVRIEPSLVEGTVDPSGKYTPAPAPAQTRVVSQSTATQVANMLEAVVTDDSGTASLSAKIPGYRVAGKTGTAQRYDENTGTYNGYTASFIGFAPTDKPALVIGVSLQAPKGQHFGSEVAAPVFQKVMQFALQSRGVPPTGTPNANLPTTY
jgi:cell division protein FtsI (penicillin-binding protein 3)